MSGYRKTRALVRARSWLACGVLVLGFPTACIANASATSCVAADPIVLGDVSSLSGSLRFPESPQAAKLAFDAVNARCGINGHLVDYEVLDDGGEPAKAIALTRELVLQRGAVALIGGTSVVGCGANADFYRSTPVASIPGTGTGPRCFDSPNISPPNSGLFSLTTLALKFAAEHLSPKKICLLGNAHPAIPGNFRDPVERFHRMSGKSVTIINEELHPDSDPQLALGQLEAAGCDVAFVGTLAQFAGHIATELGRSSNRDLRLILAPEAYTQAFLSRLNPTLSGQVFVVTDTDFLDSKRPGMTRVRTLLSKGGVELSPFAAGGALAAHIVVDAISTIQGPINRQSVLSALLRIGPYDTEGLTASAYKFAWPENRRLPAGIHVVVFENGVWAHATETWIVLEQPDFAWH